MWMREGLHKLHIETKGTKNEFLGHLFKKEYIMQYDEFLDDNDVLKPLCEGMNISQLQPIPPPCK
jgi:hypothetical protein